MAEIDLSDNTAKEFDIKKGDTISLENFIQDLEPFCMTVKNITPTKNGAKIELIKYEDKSK